MSKGLDSIRLVVENNVKSANEQIEKYKKQGNPNIWISSISYFEGIKSSNESLLRLIDHELKIEEIELQTDMELEDLWSNDGPPISIAERI